MATITFDLPDDVCQAFEQVFGDANRSAVLTGMIRDAIASRRRRQTEREPLARMLANRRASGAKPDRIPVLR